MPSPGSTSWRVTWIPLRFIQATSRPGNATFMPPPAGEVLKCMSRLEGSLNDLPGPTPVLLKAALAHVQSKPSTPFLDGNGRVGGRPDWASMGVLMGAGSKWV
jgi:hypothetical protein